MPDLNEFLEWVKQNPQRHLELKIENGGEKMNVWAYDRSLGVNGFEYYHNIKSVSEIDLERVVKEREANEFKRLIAKYPEVIPSVQV
jgi:hypothetical protein